MDEMTFVSIRIQIGLKNSGEVYIQKFVEMVDSEIIG
jgi:hypothetical protein